MPLSNTTATILSSPPYLDDFYQTSNVVTANGEVLLKGDVDDFHRILFRPGYPVQARELTQAQTILHNQLERLTKSGITNGQAVVDGHLTVLVSDVWAGAVTPSTNIAAFFNRTTNTGKFIENPTTGQLARVLQYVSTEEEDVPSNYLVFSYKSAQKFGAGEAFQDINNALTTGTFASGANSEVFTTASVASVDEGIYFVSGFLVRVAPQTIVLSPYSNRPSYRIGFEVTEEIVDETDPDVGFDLLDPTNAAPGGHRLRVRVRLAKRTLTEAAGANFVTIATVIEGQLQPLSEDPGLITEQVLRDMLARRTYDESGDYIVAPFQPVIEANPADANTFLLSLGPGKAYVRGYEIKTSEPVKKVIRKGRATQAANNRTIATPVGNFVNVSRVQSLVPATLFNSSTVDLHCVDIASINRSSTTTYAYSKVGTAKVRMLEQESVSGIAGQQQQQSVYKLFFYDVDLLNPTGNVVDGALAAGKMYCNVAVANGTPAVNGAIVGAAIVLSGASSPVTGTFTVDSYVVSGSYANVALREYCPSTPNSNTQYRLVFRLQDVDSFALVNTSVSLNTPFTSNLQFQADVHPSSKLGGVPTGATETSGASENLLLYQIPEKFVKANTLTVNTAIFKTWAGPANVAADFAGATTKQFAITFSLPPEFSIPQGSLSAAYAQEIFTVFDTTNDADGRGASVQFLDSSVVGRYLSNVSVSGSTLTMTYHVPSAGSTRSLEAFVKADVTGLAARTKTLKFANTTHVFTDANTGILNGQQEFYNLVTAPGDAYLLKAADVLRIVKVLYKASGTAFANADMSTATDVTEHFTLDNGQRDNTYEYARLIVGPNASTVIRPTGRLMVLFDWFQHSGRAYATVDSYLGTTNLTGVRPIAYDSIPNYTSPKFNRTVNLRDVLDFRPVRSNYEYITNARSNCVFEATDTNANTGYLTATDTPNTYFIPASTSTWKGSYEYYLSRIDKVGLYMDGMFTVLEGADAVNPLAPATSADTLLLFQLTIPPYTLVDANGTPTSVHLTTFEHKRYTMADLAKLDDRVAHLEYYSALNSLERITRDEAVFGADGLERFKNGFLVDSFHGGEVGDVSNPDWAASIDRMKRELRTAYNSYSLQFAPDLSSSTGVVQRGDMAIPAYSTSAFITQGVATHAVSVNPFDVASFYGTVKLSPAVDIWKETSTRPAQVIDMGGPTASWSEGNAPTFTNWGEWDLTWSGVTASRVRNQFFTPPGWTPESHDWRSMMQVTWNDVETTSVYERQGTTYEYEVLTNLTSMGSQVVDTSVIHIMRGRDVVFNATGLKPQSNLYAFFDGTSVQNYVQKANVLELAPITTPATTPFHIGQTVYVKKALTGNVNTTATTTTVLGNANTKFQYELVPGALVRVEKGAHVWDRAVATIASNTSMTLVTAAPAGDPGTLNAASIFTLTPVTVADVVGRVNGANTTYTLKVVRARRDADVDQVAPYAITAGSLGYAKNELDGGTSTQGAQVIIPAAGQVAAATLNVAATFIVSGVVRAYDSGSQLVRLDTDALNAVAGVPNVRIYFVSGPGAGQSANIVTYSSANQTATIDSSALGLVGGETIYSIGQLQADGLSNGAVVTSGRAGTCAGVFHLPAARFAVGNRLFRLTDEAGNIVEDATTAAEANYNASGLSVTMQETVVSSRSLGLRRLGPASETMAVTNLNTTMSVNWVDPLAETFLVDAKMYPQGVFITSVDLCFKGKPTDMNPNDETPVFVELRPVVNGYPSSNEIVPCVAAEGLAVSMKFPADVRTTTPSANVPSFGTGSVTFTRFEFPAPVHLMPGKEYAIVVRSDSNLYTVYTAELGKESLDGSGKVSRQPYAGCFFKSQNASTWTESPFEDLMFRLNRAVWSASVGAPLSATLVARALAPAANVTFDSFEFYPHEVHFGDETVASYTVDIKQYTESNGALAEAATRYVAMPNEWTLLRGRSMVQGQRNVVPDFTSAARASANTIDLIATLTTYSPDVAPFVDLKKMNVLAVKHYINNLPLQWWEVATVNPGAGYLVTKLTGTVNIASGTANVFGVGTAFSTELAPNDTVLITSDGTAGNSRTVEVSSVQNNSHFTAKVNNNATWNGANGFMYGNSTNANVALTITDASGGTGAAGVATIGRDGKVNGYIFSAGGSGYAGRATINVAAPSAVTGYPASLQVTATAQHKGELQASGGNALTRYITRAVTLADGFDARDIYVIFDAYRPLGSKFYVYYKVLPSEGSETARLEDQPWRLMKQETPDTTVCTGYNQFKEFKFVTSSGKALDATTDKTDRFKVFAVKVVMAASGTVDTPRLCNFRCIALDE